MKDKQYDLDEYEKLINKLYNDNPPLMLPPEYSSFAKDNMLRFLIRLARYKFVAKILQSADSVLEIGCGSGVGAIFLSQYCSHVHGIDLKEYEINEAKSINRRDNVKFEVRNFFDFPADKKFDTIVNLDVIEHMSESDGEYLISQTVKHLKDTGMFILGTPSIYSYPYQGKLSRASHVKCYDLDELKNIILKYYGRVLAFSMNDEIVHTGHPKMAWYYFVIGFYPQKG